MYNLVFNSSSFPNFEQFHTSMIESERIKHPSIRGPFFTQTCSLQFSQELNVSLLQQSRLTGEARSPFMSLEGYKRNP